MRAEAEIMAREEDYMINIYGGLSPLVLEILKQLNRDEGGSRLRRKERSVRINRGPSKKLI